VFVARRSGWVLRSDCLPFAENFEVLHSRKSRVPSFVAAAKARPHWQQSRFEHSLSNF
jgi:hypothetical protein